MSLDSSPTVYYTEDPINLRTRSHDFSTGPFFDTVDPSPSHKDGLTFVRPSEKVFKLIQEYEHFKALALCVSVPPDWTSMRFDSLQESAGIYLSLDFYYLDYLIRGAKFAVIGYLHTLLGGKGAAEAFLRDAPPLDDNERWKRRLDCLIIVRIQRERDAFAASWLPVLAAIEELKRANAYEHMSYKRLCRENLAYEEHCAELRRRSAADFGAHPSTGASPAATPCGPSTSSSSRPASSPVVPCRSSLELPAQSRALPSAESDGFDNADSCGEDARLLSQDLSRLAVQEKDEKCSGREDDDEQHELEAPPVGSFDTAPRTLAPPFASRSTAFLSSQPNPTLRRRAMK